MVKLDEFEVELDAAYSEGLDVKEKTLKSSADALIVGKRIALNRERLQTRRDRACKLAEERGHYHTTVGNIIDVSSTENRKQELRARLWAYNAKIGLDGLIRAFEHGCRTADEMAEFLGVTEKFLADTIECYRNKYGVCEKCNGYMVYFIPSFGIFQMLGGIK